MSCDVCAKVTTELVPLKPEYQSPQIAAICKECETALNHQLAKIRIAAGQLTIMWVKRFIETRIKSRK